MEFVVPYKSNKKEPDLVLILSGKRKSGKDYASAKLDEYKKKFSNRISCQKIVLASLLKKLYADKHNLNFEKLLDSSGYKEIHRSGLIE